MGVVPSRQNADSAFVLAELASDGVESSLLEEVGGVDVGQPTAYIMLARDTGSRTIISTRNHLRELSIGHFARALARADEQLAAPGGVYGDPCWVHLECREMPAVLRMAEAYRAHTPSAAARHPRVLSLEVEKPHLAPSELLPLFALCDAIFLSREFLERNQEAILGGADGGGSATPGGSSATPNEHLALRCLRALLAQTPGCRALWVVGWGALGAFALDSVTRTGHFQPAFPPERVVDSVGAGDTFIAAAIYALACGAGTEQTLRCACAVAGAKVGRTGFDNIARAATFPVD
ncbi:Ribokinase-like protein [Pavlovales sp. CCMP2436]|nr:Ribokinase-like protein [Pavlovales sp. CCMP2436]